VTAPDGSAVHKLGKKYPGAGLSSRPMTNIYLDAVEYGALVALPAATLVKRRHDVGGGFAIDVFEGALAGLILAEISADDDAELAAIVVPSWCTVEVTEDMAYAGGTLAIDGWHAKGRKTLSR
jgi:CYTH domain-containing protein